MLNQLSFWRTKRLPVLLQIEGAECGLACLSMISAYWGHRIDMASMRRRFSISLKGVTLKTLMSMAQGMSLQARALKLELEHLPDLNLPCILHWDLNHFVVLKSLSSTHAVLHDPAVGERRLSLTELAKHFTGVALELTPAAEFKKVNEVQKFTLLSLMGRVVGLKQGLVQLILLGLALQVCALVAPFYMQWLVDNALLSADRDLVTVLGIGFLLLVVLQTSIGAVRSWVTTVLATNLNIRWLGNAFAHLMKLPLPYFEKRHTGDIVSRFGSIQTMQRTLTTQFVEGIIDGVLMVGTLIMMFLYSGKLAAIACLTVVLYCMMRLTLFRPMHDATTEQIVHAAKQQSHMMESVRGVQSVRLFGRSEERRTGWMNSLTDQFNADLRIAKLSISYQTARVLLFSGERVIVIWIAALAVLNGEFSVGMLFAFIAYKDQFSERCAGLVDKAFEFRMLKVHGERVADIVMTAPEQEVYFEDVDIDQIMPTIEFRNLGFRYSDGEPDVLSNLNLTIPAGQFIAVTGPSGCGKTTLLKLMLGLLEPTQGEILVGGVTLATLGISNYRALVGTVMQEDTLFAGSIQDNIAFFDQSPNLTRVIQCAALSSIHAEIVKMPMGYNTLVGEIGSGLSGGQQQRILLARALYKNPKILALDEATSHLDLHNEQAVNAAIKKISLTRIIVAHRPETIAMAERVVYLSGGAIMRDVKKGEGAADVEGNAQATEQAQNRALQQES